MSSGVNKVIAIGNLGQDPEVKFGSGNAMAKFSIGVNEQWTDKTSGEVKKKVEWIRVVTWGKLAELCGEHLSKGRQVYIEGKLQTREYEKDGSKRYSTEVVASHVTFLGGKGEKAAPAGDEPPPHDDSDVNF